MNLAARSIGWLPDTRPTWKNVTISGRTSTFNSGEASEFSTDGALAPSEQRKPDIDQQRALHRLSQLIRQLKPLDRQIVICYLEDLDMATIAEITGLTPANVGMKIHRIKNVLSIRFLAEQRHV